MIDPIEMKNPDKSAIRAGIWEVETKPVTATSARTNGEALLSPACLFPQVYSTYLGDLADCAISPRTYGFSSSIVTSEVATES